MSKKVSKEAQSIIDLLSTGDGVNIELAITILEQNAPIYVELIQRYKPLRAALMSEPKGLTWLFCAKEAEFKTNCATELTLELILDIGGLEKLYIENQEQSVLIPANIADRLPNLQILCIENTNIKNINIELPSKCTLYLSCEQIDKYEAELKANGTRFDFFIF
jgi:hypothetical protein